MMPTSPDVVVLPFTPAEAPGALDRFARDREVARTAGYAEGWAAGHRDAQAALAAERAALAAAADAERARLHREHASALSALAAAAAASEARQVPLLDDVRDVVLSAALELATDLLGRSLTLGDGAAAALERALTAVAAARPVQVRLNPTDVETLTHATLPDGVTLVPDPALAVGDAVAEFPGGSVDARLSAALHRAREALS